MKTSVWLISLFLSSLLTACQGRKEETPAPAPVPTAEFTVAGSYVAGDSVRFTNTSANARSYRWTFGDGTTATRISPAHAYRATGWQVVTLQATGPGGQATVARKLFIRAYPILNWTCHCKVITPYTKPRVRLPDEQARLSAEPSQPDRFVFYAEGINGADYGAQDTTKSYTVYRRFDDYHLYQAYYYPTTDSIIVAYGPREKYSTTAVKEFHCRKQ